MSILVPIDRSLSTKTAFTFALALAQSRQAPLLLYAVVDREAAGASESQPAVRRLQRLRASVRARRLLAMAVEMAADAGVTATATATYGDAAEEIVASARSSRAETIVVGTTYEAADHPGVAEALVRFAPCPVIVVGSAAEEEDRYQGVRHRPLFALRLIDVAQGEYERVRGDLGLLIRQLEQQLRVQTNLFGTADARRLGVVARFLPTGGLAREQWQTRFDGYLTRYGCDAATYTGCVPFADEGYPRIQFKRFSVK